MLRLVTLAFGLVAVSWKAARRYICQDYICKNCGNKSYRKARVIIDGFRVDLFLSLDRDSCLKYCPECVAQNAASCAGCKGFILLGHPVKFFFATECCPPQVSDFVLRDSAGAFGYCYDCAPGRPHGWLIPGRKIRSGPLDNESPPIAFCVCEREREIWV